MSMSRMILVTMLAMPFVARYATSTMPVVPETEVAFAIHVGDMGKASDGKPQLVFMAWTNGGIVWSEDQIKGGAPYRTAKVPPEVLQKALERLETRGVFDDKSLSNVRFGPSSKYTTIRLVHSGKELEVSSWHELFEQNPRTQVGSKGVSALSEPSQLAALKKEPAEYLHYRLVWAELRLAAARLITAKGQKAKGLVDYDGKNVRWRSIYE